MTIIGVDPGFTGGFCALGSSGILELMPMPVVKLQMSGRTKGGNVRQKTIIDVAAVRRFLLEFDRQTTQIVMEEVGVMPDQGAVSGFNFGEAFGTLKGMFSGIGFGWSMVRPRVWKKAMFPNSAISEQVRVAEVFPGVNFRATERSKMNHSGLCDAALIAKFYEGVLLKK